MPSLPRGRLLQAAMNGRQRQSDHHQNAKGNGKHLGILICHAAVKALAFHEKYRVQKWQKNNDSEEDKQVCAGVFHKTPVVSIYPRASS